MSTKPSTTTGPGTDLGEAPRTFDDVPGWLNRTDQLLFRWLLTQQNRRGPHGDLLELGVYLGKSAIFMGNHLTAGETFTACDLFDLARDDQSIRPGARKAYETLTQRTFERNYLAFHDQLPVVIRGRTDVILDHVAPSSCRFVHIDASHMYEHVRGDLLAARKLLCPDGIVVFDDYRTEHCPGTAAAVWEAMATEDLKVICVSATKFYGTWGDPARYQPALIEMIAGRADHRVDLQAVMGQRLVRVVRLPKQQSATPPNAEVTGRSVEKLLAQSVDVLRTAQAVLEATRPVPGAARVPTATAAGRGWRAVGLRWLPPAVIERVRSIRRRRAARRSANM